MFACLTFSHRWVAVDGGGDVHLEVISDAITHQLEVPVGGNEAHDPVLLEPPVPHARVERAVVDNLFRGAEEGKLR